MESGLVSESLATVMVGTSRSVKVRDEGSNWKSGQEGELPVVDVS